MLDALTSSLSGIRFGSATLDAAAHNLANLNTEGFRRQEVRGAEQEGGGVASYLVEGVDDGPAGDLVAALIAKHTVSLNVATARQANSTYGSLLDILS